MGNRRLGPSWGRRRSAVATMRHYTAAATLNKYDSGMVVTNRGATSAVTLTLPQDTQSGDGDSYKAALFYDFINMSGLPMFIDPGSVGAIVSPGRTGSDDAPIALWQKGHSVRLYRDEAYDWFAANLNRPEGVNRTAYNEDFRLRAGINANRDVPAGDTYNTAQMQLGVDKHPLWEILGTNGTSALATFDADGGLLLTTAGADGDEMIICPHVNSDVSVFKALLLNSAQQPYFRTRIRTQASVAKIIIWAGLKLTNTEVTATDDDQAMFRVEDDVNTAKFQAVSSRDGTDTETDTGVTVAANTDYDLEIIVDAERKPHFFINGVLVVSGAALITGELFLPFVGVAADGTAPGAKAIQVRDIYVSRNNA